GGAGHGPPGVASADGGLGGPAGSRRSFGLRTPPPGVGRRGPVGSAGDRPDRRLGGLGALAGGRSRLDAEADGADQRPRHGSDSRIPVAVASRPQKPGDTVAVPMSIPAEQLCALEARGVTKVYGDL